MISIPSNTPFLDSRQWKWAMDRQEVFDVILQRAKAGNPVAFFFVIYHMEASHSLSPELLSSPSCFYFLNFCGLDAAKKHQKLHWKNPGAPQWKSARAARPVQSWTCPRSCLFGHFWGHWSQTRPFHGKNACIPPGFLGSVQWRHCHDRKWQKGMLLGSELFLFGKWIEKKIWCSGWPRSKALSSLTWSHIPIFKMSSHPESVRLGRFCGLGEDCLLHTSCADTSRTTPCLCGWCISTSRMTFVWEIFSCRLKTYGPRPQSWVGMQRSSATKSRNTKNGFRNKTRTNPGQEQVCWMCVDIEISMGRLSLALPKSLRRFCFVPSFFNQKQTLTCFLGGLGWVGG